MDAVRDGRHLMNAEEAAPEMRCDVCGPYTPEQAAALVLGKWKPKLTGHICDQCRLVIAIDEKAAAEIYWRKFR